MYNRQLKPTLAFLVYLTACASSHVVPRVSSEAKASELQIPEKNISLSNQSWSFRPQKEFNAYTSRTQATIQTDLDSPVTADTVLTTVHFLLGLNRSENVDTISGYIDYRTFVSGHRAGTEQKPLTVPWVFSGRAIPGRLLLNPLSTRPDIGFCQKYSTGYYNDLHPALFFLPQHLQVGARWSDTVSILECSDITLPSKVEIVRSYLVQGITQIDDLHLVLIARTEVIHVSGSGSEGQHRISFEGEGSGTSQIFLDPESGTIHLIEINQQLSLALHTSGKLYRFTQHVQQTITLTSVTSVN